MPPGWGEMHQCRVQSCLYEAEWNEVGALQRRASLVVLASRGKTIPLQAHLLWLTFGARGSLCHS